MKGYRDSDIIFLVIDYYTIINYDAIAYVIMYLVIHLVLFCFICVSEMSTYSGASSDSSSDSSSECRDSPRELLKLEKAKSPVWEYFGFPAENGQYLEKDKKKRTEVYCRLCLKKMNYLGNNIISHLEYNHHSEYLKVKAKTATGQKCSAVSANPQPPISEAFRQLEPLSTNSKRWKTLNQSVSHCIAKDMLPISIVNNVGFQAMLRTFEPRYVVPDRKTFSQNYIPEIYQSEKARIAAAMARGLKNFSLTTDGWTSRANHSYITHTVHYIDELWNLQAHLLDTAEMPLEHTGVNLADELKDSLARWDLKDDDLVSITTDNARNIVCATEILSWPRFGCLALTLQIGVKKAMEIPQISRALARARRVVTHFHHSSKSSYILKQK